MTLSELILHVGNDNCQFQTINDCCAGATTNKRGETTLKICTKAINTTDVLFPKNAKMRGIIIWIPVDKLPESMRK